MRLDDEERAMLAGELGPARQFGMRQHVRVGEFFDAEDCVAVSQVHLMADTESLGESGVAFLEGLAALPEAERRVRVATITDPRGTDLRCWKQLGQSEQMVGLERRTMAALRALGILLTDTCINYQSVMPPVQGEHLAFGDTGSSIYANSVLGARTNFEGGPSALAAALTGRVPRFGLHLERHRRGTCRYVIDERPRDWSQWGALGGLIGRDMRSYFDIPVIEGAQHAPTSDELKHFGAALASYGSTPLFHMPGVTPEAPDLQSVFDGPPPPPRTLGRGDVETFLAGFACGDDHLDVVVFAAPQLSLLEMQRLAELLDGVRVHASVALLAATSPEIKTACDRMGLTARIEAAGASVLSGVCFYQMYAREIGVARGWKRLMSNSAKLVNIIAGYGYEPVLGSMEQCVRSAVAGRML